MGYSEYYIEDKYNAKVVDVREFTREGKRCVSIILQNEKFERERYEFTEDNYLYYDVVLMVREDIVAVIRYTKEYIGERFEIRLVSKDKIG